MSIEPGQDLETIYDSYWDECAYISTDLMRAYRPYGLGGGVLALVFGAFPMIAALLGKMPPGAFWGGAILAVIIIGIAIALGVNAQKKVIERVAQSKPGFAEFYKLYRRGNYWPSSMVTGEKLDKFLTITGRKSP